MAKVPTAVTAMNAGLRMRVEGLLRCPFFAGAGELRLSHLASNLTEVELRQGDEFIKVGQRMTCCYLVLEGFVKVYAPADESTERGGTQDAILPVSAQLASMLSFAEAMLTGAGLTPRPQSGGGGRILPAQTAAGFVPRLPSKPPRIGRAPPRRQGQPRLGAPWVDTLRETPVGWPRAPSSEELDFGCLHAGDAFGIGMLNDEVDPDRHYTSEMAVRVESCTCRLLMLTRRCLWYLPEQVVATTRAVLKSAEDPLKLPPERVAAARQSGQRWAAQKQRLLAKEMLTVR